MNIKKIGKFKMLAIAAAICVVVGGVANSVMEYQEEKMLENKAKQLVPLYEAEVHQKRRDIATHFKLENINPNIIKTPLSGQGWQYTLEKLTGKTIVLATRESSNSVRVNKPDYESFPFSGARVIIKDENLIKATVSMDFSARVIPCSENKEHCYINLTTSDGNKKMFAVAISKDLKAIDINKPEEFVNLIRNSPWFKIEVPLHLKENVNIESHIGLGTFVYEKDILIWKEYKVNK